jgi:carboxylesterase
VAVNTRPFTLDGARDVGVLCLHGFTSTPYEVRGLGEALHRLGATVRGPLLPGHGTTARQLDATTWRDWFGAVEAHYLELRARCAKVAVVGQSMGGLLGTYLAVKRPEVTAVASLGAPLWLDGLGRRVARWTGPGGCLHGRVREVPKLGGSDIADLEAKASFPSYPTIPLAALHSLCELMVEVDGVLGQVRPPILVMHARQDHTAPVAGAYRMAVLAAAERLVVLDRSYHLISLDLERDIVEREVVAFMSRHLF